MQLVPFDSQDKLPAYLTQGTTPDINKDVVRAASFPTMSIKGKVFTLNKDGVRKLITKPDDPDEVAQSLGVVVLRANMAAKVFYARKFSEGDSDGAIPDCYSYDTVAPSQHAKNPQSKKCATCPHHVWGSRVGDGDKPGEERKGRACSDTGRIAIAAPTSLDDAMLMRVPPASLKNLREAVKIVDQRKIPYNAVVMKVSFDPEAASPTLRFKPIGLLTDGDYAKVQEMYDSELVRGITGVDDVATAEAVEAAQGPVSTDELDAAIAAREAATKAANSAKVTPAPTQTPAPAPIADAPAPAKPARQRAAAPKVDPEEVAQAAAPVAAPVAAPTAPVASDAGSLLSDLDALLGGSDD